MDINPWMKQESFRLSANQQPIILPKWVSFVQVLIISFLLREKNNKAVITFIGRTETNKETNRIEDRNDRYCSNPNPAKK